MKPGDWIVWRVEFLDHVTHQCAEIESVGQKTVVAKKTGVGGGATSRIAPSTIVFAGTRERATKLYLDLAGSKRQYDNERRAARAEHLARCAAIIAKPRQD